MTMTAAEHLNESPRDPYWQNRIAGAKRLVARGLGAAVYQTQYMSGRTSWKLPDGQFVTEDAASDEPEPAPMAADLPVQTDIKVGDRVKSYDFPDNDPERREQCYVEGVVEAIDFGCYRIKAEKRVFRGEVVEDEATHVFPPVNGRPTTFGKITNGVVKVEG